MTAQPYEKQVRLLLGVLPCVSKEPCFALHGGTAINLFVRDMPRLSVDIDLTYLPLEERSLAMKNIGDALARIKERIENATPGANVAHTAEKEKLFVRAGGAEIKVEVNLVGRGTIAEAVRMQLCENVQKKYELSAFMKVVPFGQLYGGKICAALDRQHPRDLFDVKILLDTEGFPESVRQGFLLCLLCGNRPINEVLIPNFQDQRKALENQFAGMSESSFTYADFEQTRERLVQTIKGSLTPSDKGFLLSVKNGEPDWSVYDFERFPGIQWKLKNVRELKKKNPKKHRELLDALKKKIEE